MGSNYNRETKIIQESAWAFYDDSTYTVGSPLVVDGARTQVTIDGLGAFTEKRFLPADTTDFWSNNRIWPGEAGEAYNLRLDFTAKIADANGWMDVELDIGDGSPIIVIVDTTAVFPKGNNAYHPFSIALPIFCLETFVANGGALYFNTEESVDTVTIYNIGLLIQRVNKPINFK